MHKADKALLPETAELGHSVPHHIGRSHYLECKLLETSHDKNDCGTMVIMPACD